MLSPDNVMRAERQAQPLVFIARNDVHRNVTRRRIVLQTIEQCPAGHVRKADIERDGAGLELLGERERRDCPADATRAFSPLLVGHVQQDARRRSSSSMISRTRIAVADRVAVVIDDRRLRRTSVQACASGVGRITSTRFAAVLFGNCDDRGRLRARFSALLAKAGVI